MSNGAVDISKIDLSFGGANEPKDEHFIQLIQSAYKHETDCHKAIINIELIKPFSNYKPKIDPKYREFIEKKFADDELPMIYVYQKDDFFIMSDDYKAFEIYKEQKSPIVLAIVLGLSTIKEGVEYGPAFKLPPPEIQEI